MYIHYDWIPIMGSMTTKCMPSHTMSRPLAHIIGWETSKRDGRFHVSDLVWHRKLRVESMKKGVIKLFSRYVCVCDYAILCVHWPNHTCSVYFSVQIYAHIDVCCWHAHDDQTVGIQHSQGLLLWRQVNSWMNGPLPHGIARGVSSGYVKIALENGHRNSRFSRFSIAIC